MQAPAFSRYRSTVFSFFTMALAIVIAGCSSVPTAPKSSSPSVSKPALPNASVSRQPALPAAGSGRGGYYQDDGPGESPPGNLLAIPDAEPKIEPVLPSTNRPYVVFGKTYQPLAANQPLKQRGIGSWYGKKFHGQKTASGERYDMYKMTAAHPTMPLPSYARVTNLSNGNQVIVRVNDRGPFHSGRIIDLSYTAAMKLGYVGKGSSELEVERLLPDEIARLEKSRLGERAVVQTEPAMRVPRAAVLSAAPLPTSSVMAVDPQPRVETVALATPVSTLDSTRSALGDSAGLSTVQQITDIRSVSPSVTSPSAAGGFYLQLGAFSQMPNAEAARLRFARDATDTLPQLEVAQTGSVFKLFSGPFLTRTDAALAAQKLADTGGEKPFIVQR
jgi:rare lipoprotein A